MMRHMNQLCDIVKGQENRTEEQQVKVYICDTRESADICAICMTDQGPVAFNTEGQESGRVNGLTVVVGEEMLVFCSQCNHRVHKACL